LAFLPPFGAGPFLVVMEFSGSVIVLLIRFMRGNTIDARNLAEEAGEGDPRKALAAMLRMEMEGHHLILQLDKKTKKLLAKG